MKNMGIKFFAYIAIVLMLASVIPAVALADSDNGQKKGLLKGDDQSEEDDDIPGVQIHDRDRTRINATENATLNETANQLRNVKNAQAAYAQAKKDFLNAKSKNKNLDSEEAINATKEYLNSTIDWMIESLDEDEDSDYIEALNAEKEDIDAATTRAELAESAKDVRDIWNDARKDRISTKAKSVNNKLNSVIKSSEAIALRLDNEISRMEQNGEDVTELRVMLVEYNALIAEAKEYQNQAMDGETVSNMNQAGQSIKDANAILKNMLKELKQHREGLVVLSGNGNVTAEGNGTAVISGNFTLNFTTTDAMLVIKDMAGDAEINTSDASFDSSNVDSGYSEDNNRAFVYHNLTGDVTIEGTRLTVMLRGADVSLDVSGLGTVMLTGNGTYEIGGVEKSWATPDLEEDEEEDEAVSSDNAEDADDDSESESGNAGANESSSNNSSSYYEGIGDFSGDDGNYSSGNNSSVNGSFSYNNSTGGIVNQTSGSGNQTSA